MPSRKTSSLMVSETVASSARPRIFAAQWPRSLPYNALTVALSALKGGAKPWDRSLKSLEPYAPPLGPQFHPRRVAGRVHQTRTRQHGFLDTADAP